MTCRPRVARKTTTRCEPRICRRCRRPETASPHRRLLRRRRRRRDCAAAIVRRAGGNYRCSSSWPRRSGPGIAPRPRSLGARKRCAARSSSSSSRATTKARSRSRAKPRALFPTIRCCADSTPLFTATFSVATSPPDADVYVRTYGATDGEWRRLGRSPLTDVKVPRVPLRWRIEKPGFASAERATTSQDDNLGAATSTSRCRSRARRRKGWCSCRADPPPDREPRNDRRPRAEALFHRPVRGHEQGVQGVRRRRRLPNPEYWQGLEFIKDGVQLTFEQAVVEFVDSTGRPGPATWEPGLSPNRRDDYPVTGVSWFEAAAYARFRGKSLPTVYHWTKAVCPTPRCRARSRRRAPLSNFGGSGPEAVGLIKASGLMAPTTCTATYGNGFGTPRRTATVGCSAAAGRILRLVQ